MPAAARHRGLHRKPLGASREHGFRTRSGGAAARPVRPIAATAGVALIGASVIAGTPVPSAAAASPSEIRVVRSDVGLAAASSVLNVPVNLLIDLVNIPYNEVQALDFGARSLFFSGPWFVVSPTNIWGVDPGDPGHFMAVVNLLVPFPALSGLGLDQSNPNGLGQQVWQLAAAELPVNKYCDVNGCFPGSPVSPITGITGVDNVLWGLALTAGLYGFAPGAWVKFPLLNNYFTVPLTDLVSGYTFGPNFPGYADPSGPVYPGFGFAGTTLDPETGENLVPWANTTFTLDLSKPFQNYFDHLMADPATNPIQLPTLEEFGRTLQTLAAALVIAFDPLTPGSGLCTGGLGNCSWLPPALDYPGIVKGIGDLWPGNPVINEWLDALANGTANVPTKEQIETAVKLAEQSGSFWDFGNPSPPPELIGGFNLNTLAPFFHKLWTDLGLNPPPLNPPAPGQEPDDLNAPTDGPVNELRAFEKASQLRLPPSMTPNLTPVNLDTAPVAPDGQVMKDVSTQAQQDVESITKDVQSITGAATGAPADAAAVPNNADTKAGQKLATDTTRDGNMAVPGKVGGTGTNPRGGLGGALRSAADQISSGISKITGGFTGETSTGGTKTGETSTGGTKTSESGTGGTKAGESGTSTGGRHRAE